jgi:hypothetical protein
MAHVYFAYHAKLAKENGTATATESDQMIVDVVVAAAAAYRSARDRVTKHHMADARGAPLSDPMRIPQSQLVPVAGVAEAWAAASYAQNDEYQAHTQQPVASGSGSSVFQRLEQEVEVDCRAAAAAVVARHIFSVFPNQPLHRGAIEAVTAVTSSSSGTYLVPQENLVLHVWKSRREARRFHEALRRVAQAKFEHMIPSPIHVPLAALVCHQGAYVSVVWLPPLASSDPIVAAASGAVGLLMHMLACCLGLRGDANGLKLYTGADGRYYILPVPTVVLEPSEVSVAMATDTANCVQPVTGLRRFGWAPSSTLATTPTGLISLAARAIVSALQRYELRLPPRTTQAAAAEQAIRARVVSHVLRNVGLSHRWLYEVFNSPALRSSSSAPASHIVTVSLVSEMVSRAVAAVGLSSLFTARVPDAASIEVHHVSRIVGLNRMLELFVSSDKNDVRRFIEAEVMPVVRMKFVGLPANVVFSVNNINTAGVMQRVADKLRLELDMRGRAFLRFLPPTVKELTRFAAPRLIAAAWDERMAETVQGIEATLLYAVQEGYDFTVASVFRAHQQEADASVGGLAETQPVLALAALMRLCRTARLTKTREHVGTACDMLAAFVEQVDHTSPVFSLAVGILCEIGANSHITEDAAKAHVSLVLPLLAEGAGVNAVVDETDDAFAVERLRVTAARLLKAAPAAVQLATQCFEVAKRGFRRQFRFGGCDASSIYFEMSALEVQYAIKTIPVEEIIGGNFLDPLLNAVTIGADQPQRREIAGTLLYRLMGNLVAWYASDTSHDDRRLMPSEDAAIEFARACVTLTTKALRLVHAVDGVRSNVVLVAFGHILTLLAVIGHSFGSDERDEHLPRMRQFVRLLREAADTSDEESRNVLLSSDWTVSTVALFATTAMRHGQWHAAAQLFHVLSGRYRALNDSASIGYEALRRPVRMLERAHEVTAVISRHYNRYLVASNTRPRGVVPAETLHRRGIVEMEMMAIKSLVKRRCTEQRRLCEAAEADEAAAISRSHVEVRLCDGIARLYRIVRSEPPQRRDFR